MAAVTTYVTRDEVKAHLGLAASDTNDDAILTSKIVPACRAVDGLCRRRFWRDPVSPDPTSTRLYRPISSDWCPIDDLIVDADTVISLNDADDGTTFVVLPATSYITHPLNGIGQDGQPGWPVTALELVDSSRSFGWWMKHLAVKVVGRWGWIAVPDAVKEATLMIVADLFHYKDVRSGTIGFNEFGPVTVRSAVAAHARSLLLPYGGGSQHYLVA